MVLVCQCAQDTKDVVPSYDKLNPELSIKREKFLYGKRRSSNNEESNFYTFLWKVPSRINLYM